MAVTTSKAGRFCVDVGVRGPPHVGVSDWRSGHGRGSGRAKMSNLKYTCLLYTSPSPRDRQKSRMPSSA